ncbi:hypothetical protein [Streptomyces sp. S584]|uniref:hypothetical protein n=1 Tax=Streptomyces sp. S584 TaxID=3096010 RepID=UPI002AFFCC99|nr:hypothetical protein [Streptomyces sp. S584]
MCAWIASSRQRAILTTDASLEQQRGRLLPRTFTAVVGADQGNGARGLPGAADDRAQDVGELRADQQQPLGIRLGRDDLQQGDEFTGGGQPVLDQAVVAEFQQFLDADTGGPQDLDHGPGPEGPLLFESQIAALSGGRVLGPDPAGRSVRNHSAFELLTGSGEHLAGGGMPGGFQSRGSVLAALADRADTHRQYRQVLAGASVHPRLAPPLYFAVLQLVSPHRAWCHPRASVLSSKPEALD